MLYSLRIRFQPNTATHGQSNVINATVAIVMPRTLPANVTVVRAKPLAQMAQAQARSGPRKMVETSVSFAPATVYQVLATPPVRSDATGAIASIRWGSQPMKSDSAKRSKARPAVARRKAPIARRDDDSQAPHQA
jgi:hypothetical protein